MSDEEKNNRGFFVQVTAPVPVGLEMDEDDKREVVDRMYKYLQFELSTMAMAKNGLSNKFADCRDRLH